MLTSLAVLAGLLLGSFTNVLIARIPIGEQWIAGSSRCPSCRYAIAWFDNIPVLSWLALRGRCRNCRARISVRYPVTELIVAGLVGAVTWVYGLSILTVVLAVLAVFTVALVAIDFETMRLPTPLVWSALGTAMFGLAVDATVAQVWLPYGRAVLGAMILGGAYFVLWFAKPNGLGFGDVRLAVVLGFVSAYLGWAELAVTGIAGPVLGAAGAVVVVWRARRVSGVKMPFGPWMIVAFWLGVIVGDLIAETYVGWVASW
ncbi:A24 family peptidase [Demequina sp. NBRC 110051]|uniref:prepilin peptidase n=1 Tax=Demequina sp. NBRC 110051 TaxID=1570340 RepID=UPI000A043ADE|nr:A24 family peptidase [Demequina sp. NBRC 110051]